MLGAALGSSVHAQAQGESHKVQPGDTLWGIARQQLGSPSRWKELRDDNAVRIPGKLRPGEVLQLRGAMTVVVELSGTAWLKRGNEAQGLLTLGTAIRAGDTLTTDHGAFLCLALTDGSRIVVPSASAVRVLAADGRLMQFELLSGRLESHVEKQNRRRFEVRTRTLGLGVRGTHFRTGDEDNVVTAEVIEGEVEVAGGARRGRLASIGPAQGAVLSLQTSPRATRLLPAPRRTETAPGPAIEVAPIEGARSYRIQLAGDDEFLRLIHEYRSAVPNFALPRTLEAGFYHVRVTAFDNEQLEGLPGDSIVYLGSPPPPPAQILPSVPAELRAL
jgi:hypothetical protein